MSAASAAGESAAMPVTTDPACPASGSGFTARRTGRPETVSARAPYSGGTTTTMSSRPASMSADTVWWSTGRPSRSRRSLGWPMRRDSPAARTTPPITRGLLLRRRLDRALREDFEEMLLVVDRALEVGLHVHAVRGLVRGGLDARRVQRLPGEGGLHTLRAHRVGARPGDADRGLRALAALDRQDRGHAHHREARGGVRELHVRGALIGGERGHAHLGEDLVGAHR